MVQSQKSSLVENQSLISDARASEITDKTSQQRTLKLGYILITLAIIVGFLTRLVAVFQYVTFDIGPDPDQIRDAFTVMQIWQGILPTLGPPASVGGHHIFPLYYYLFWPFTLLGADPALQVLPNGLFSFLSIPLFMYLVYQLLERVENSRRVFLSGLGGFWYSLLFGDIFISNFQWNPSSILFFMMLLTLLYRLQMQGDFSFPVQVLLWSMYGVVLVIMMNLHSSTLFVMPVIFLITSSVFILCKASKKKRNLSLIFLPCISALSGAISLLPYWIGEIGRGFQNTKAILKTISNSSQDSQSHLIIGVYNKLTHLFLGYISLAQQAYFWNDSLLYLLLSIIFLALVSWWGILKFRGNQHIWLIWCSTWLIFLLAASNLSPFETPLYYKSLILFAPIVLTLSTLAYLDLGPKQKDVFSIVVGFFIILSMVSNITHDYRFMVSKYGHNRLANTREIAQILQEIPSNSTICDPRLARKREVNNQYHYIDTYITHNGITVVSDCQPGNLVIHPKRNMLIESNFLNSSDYQATYFVKSNPPPLLNLFPTFKVVKNEAISRPAELVREIETAYVYRLD
jgi:hypothetical protein